jgi:pimeloyl-ACP methyl ester carboxylesterase
MLGRLVETTTDDGLKLHGFWVEPKQPASHVWILVHGVNGNFYGSTFLTSLAECCLAAGQAAVLINTRGHDLASFGSGDAPVRIGSMFETMESAPLDLAAWIQWATQQGFQQVGLMSHSLGAVKSLFALAHGLQGIERLVAISPPRLNTELLVADPNKSKVFREHLEQARSLCESGHDHQIMRVRFPLPNWVSAATFLDKYGSGDKYDYQTLWPRISIPCLWLFGSLEVRQGSSNFLNADQCLTEQWGLAESSLQHHHRLDVIDHADHSYRNARPALHQSILRWIEP